MLGHIPERPDVMSTLNSFVRMGSFDMETCLCLGKGCPQECDLAVCGLVSCARKPGNCMHCQKWKK